MKKIIYLGFLFLLLVSLSTVSFAKEKVTATKPTSEQVELRISEIKDRVEEIKNMDKSNLSLQDKKELRQELRQIKKEANAISNGGIYLSITALLVIIIILLIL